ncbi:MAG: DUF6266 family protein [Pedobacter sp.]|uniref:DUF6266 family protein n=1 Tax=Pedobacter sp. TaxID=1411316 RepID=UPI0033912A56
MGKLINGPMGTVVGKVGGYVTYFLNGELVTRAIGVVDHWSDAQYAVQMKTALITALLKPVKPVIRKGMKYTPKPKRTWTAYSMATSANNPAAITGDYPELKIDYGKVVLSLGDIPAPLNPKVQLSDGRIAFTWEADLDREGADVDDRVMCVAYFPETYQSFNVTDGAKRGEEYQEIKLPSFTEEMKIETYICYFSEDRKQSSNSVYLGQLTWTKD